MRRSTVSVQLSGSLPSRERGLKSVDGPAGRGGVLSLPSRERGLKLPLRGRLPVKDGVAPFTGAWIEIGLTQKQFAAEAGRSLHGSVD